MPSSISPHVPPRLLDPKHHCSLLTTHLPLSTPNVIISLANTTVLSSSFTSPFLLQLSSFVSFNYLRPVKPPLLTTPNHHLSSSKTPNHHILHIKRRYLFKPLPLFGHRPIPYSHFINAANHHRESPPQVDTTNDDTFQPKHYYYPQHSKNRLLMTPLSWFILEIREPTDF